MSNIVPIIGDLSGLRRFWFVRIRDIVLPFPVATGGIISDDINLGSVDWSEGYCTRETGSEVGELAGSMHGDFHKKSINFFVPGNNPELKAMFDVEMKDERYIVLYEDNAGNTILVGTPEEFLKFSYKFETGEKSASRKGYQITFAGDSTSQDYYYTGAINDTAGSYIPSCQPVSIYIDDIFETNVASGGTYNFEIEEFTLTCNFPAGAILAESHVSKFKGTISLAALPANVASFTLWVVRGSTATPYTSVPLSVAIEDRDVLHLECVPTSLASPVSFVFRIDYETDALVKSTALPVGNYRYHYQVNYFDQTVTVTDLFDDSKTTIGLTAGKSFRTCKFRPSDQCVYVWGVAWYAKIDANPASGTFRTVLTSAAITGGVTYTGSSLDSHNDNFALGNTVGSFHIFNPGAGTITNRASWLQTSGAIFASGKITYLPSLKAFAVVGESSQTVAIVSTEDQFTTWGGGLYIGLLREFRGKLYASRVLSIINILSMGSPFMKPLASVSNTGSYAGGVCFDPVRNRAWFTNRLTATIGVLDCATGLSLGIISGFATVGAFGCRDIQYCPYNGLIYAQPNENNTLTGLNKIYIFDPAAGSYGAYLGFTTVGNMDSTSLFLSNQMCFNGLEQ